MKEKNSSIVKQSQEMTLMNFRRNANGIEQKPMTIIQCRIRYRIIEALQRLFQTLPRLNNGQVDTKAIKSELVKVKISDILTDNSNNYREVRRQADGLVGHLFSYEMPGYDFFDVTMISSVRKKRKTETNTEAVLELEISASFIECLVRESQWMTFLDTDVACSLSSKYAMRMYELIVGHKYGFDATQEQLKDWLDVAGEYNDITLFNRHVIKKAQSELNENSPWSFTCEYKKSEESGWVYHITPVPLDKNFNDCLSKDEVKLHPDVTSWFKSKGFSMNELKGKNADTIREFCSLQVRNKRDIINSLWALSNTEFVNNPKAYFMFLLKTRTEEIRKSVTK